MHCYALLSDDFPVHMTPLIYLHSLIYVVPSFYVDGNTYIHLLKLRCLDKIH